MATVDVKVNIPSILDAIKALGPGQIDIGIKRSGVAIAGKIVEKWNKGVGGENTTLQSPPISSGYKKKKEDSGRNGVIDFIYTGDLQRSFGVKNTSGGVAKIAFTNEQLPKARSLVDKRPQSMETGPKLQNVGIFHFNAWLTKLVKVTKTYNLNNPDGV